MENDSIDLTHIKVSGALFAYDCTDSESEQKDDFILKKLNQKSKIGGKIFIDLRYSRFWPHPSPNAPKDLVSAKHIVKKLVEKDPDFFVDFSYSHNNESLIYYWHDLLRKTKEEMRDVVNKNAQSKAHADDRVAFENLQERVRNYIR